MPVADVRQTVDLRILETTDLHVHLHPYDYYADCPNPDFGLSRLAELVDRARAESGNTLLFDNGDFLQGTPVGDFFAYDMGLREGDLHPVMAAMNAMRYDAITIGNHEFNYGLAFLEKSLARAEFPVVSANIVKSMGRAPREDRMLVKPYSLLRRHVRDRIGLMHELTVGVLGVAPPQIMTWERQQLQGRLNVRDMVESVGAWVLEMREAGADLIVLLAHTGIGPLRHAEGMENAVIPLARIDGVDVVLSGHTHQVFPSRAFADIPSVDVDRGMIAGKPAVMSGFFGSHLGVIDMALQRDGGVWRVVNHHVETRALRDASMNFPQVAADRNQPMRSPKVRKIVERAHDAVLASIRQPIGRSETPINSFFVYLGYSAATALVAQAQQAFVTARIDPALADLPMLSAVSPSKAGGLGGARNYTNIAAGQLTLRSMADLYVYPNKVAASRLTGAQLALWLERSASAFNRIHPDLQDQPLMNTAFPGYNFEIIYGLTYDMDLSQPARFGPDGTERDPTASRICNIRFNGAPLDMAAEFVLCTNSFRAQGAGGFPGATPEAICFEHPAIVRDVLREHVERRDMLQVDATTPFRLLPIDGATVILRTAPAALDHLRLISDYAPEVMGADKTGFLRLRLSLG
ncbi:MAG: bifunctional 2',3'-cyclic-nucleotide 2'-phosphodiesterase/3'-nucleotidase [Alphaproteobacteria bacterium]|nr:bifunctional 2',3'-cyclic-nucleotide 2'-phosphodiesterase/3'-nucleotidase [Alphaproteobacteria bacterium]